MPEAKLVNVFFKNLRYDLDQVVTEPQQVSVRIGTQVGCHKDRALHRGVVRTKFQLTSLTSPFSMFGECLFYFSVEGLEGELTPQIVRDLCTKPAYDEFEKRMTSLMKTLGAAKGINFPDFENWKETDNVIPGME